MQSCIEKYLGTYAEPLWTDLPKGTFDECVVVPLCGEDSLVPGLLHSLERAAGQAEAKTLAILVVNESQETPSAFREANQSLIRQLHDRPPNERLQCYVIDHTGAKQFEPKRGVGLARKVGCDFALRLVAAGRLASKWIHTTDADARVDGDYFNVAQRDPRRWGLGPMDTAAVVHPFRHSRDGDWGELTACYESYLRYYCRGLENARSPFAFPTIGSTLSFTAEAYAKVRGFPRREAGEDFYFLHKISKIAYVQLGGGAIELTARPSTRVPFGTGQSVTRLAELRERGEPYRVYDPHVFELLARWQKCIAELSEGANWETATANLALALPVLLQMGAFEQWQQIQQTRPRPADRLRHWHTWFDGFRTLRFIHLLRESHFPSIPLEEALKTSGFGGLADGKT